MENSFSHNNYNKICCFAGHSSIFGKKDLSEKLKKEIINLIENHNVATFYNGGKVILIGYVLIRLMTLKRIIPL